MYVWQSADLSISIASDKGQYQQAEFRLSWECAQRICEPKCISLWMYAMFFSVLLMFAIWPDWSEERIPFHPLWRSEGLWRGGESSSRQVSNTWYVWNCRFACFWVRVRCFWNFLLVLTCTLFDILHEIRCVAMGTLSIQKPWTTTCNSWTQDARII